LRFRIATRQSPASRSLESIEIMSDLLIADAGAAAPIHLIGRSTWESREASLPGSVTALLALSGFSGAAGDLALVPRADGGLDSVYFGMGDAPQTRAMPLRGLVARLPAGDYRLAQPPPGLDDDLVAVAWLLGAYRFSRYRQAGEHQPARLATGARSEQAEASAIAAACALAMDMVNTPANDMGPEHIEAIALEVAEVHGAEARVTRAADLVEAGYPLVHAVGRAADPQRAPRFIEFAWGDPGHPVIVLIGKGVAFDSGGLDIKPSAGMRLMKKDMGGAAHALALAQMIMANALPVRLHVLIPAVENAISANAMRPGDVLPSRNGLTVEVGNTDAEGRLILADALTRAGELSPVLTIDMATLTGAARIALGPDIVPFYTEDDALAADLARISDAVEDPLWRMPMWPGYESGLDSDIADLKNDPDAWVQAGSVAAALFLKRFAPAGAWVHLDIFAWNPRARPGWPQGAAAQAIRALYAMLKERYR
jgi:leucyl aminopeptidase